MRWPRSDRDRHDHRLPAKTLRALVPVGRMGTSADVVIAILFLAGRDAGFITGEVLDVNGGMWCD